MVEANMVAVTARVLAVLPKRIIAKDTKNQGFMEEHMKRALAEDSDTEFGIQYSPLHGTISVSFDLIAPRPEDDNLVCQTCLYELTDTFEDVTSIEDKIEEFTCICCGKVYK